MPLLAILRHEERVTLNQDSLATLCAELGEAEAERMILRAMEDLGARLTELQRLADEGHTVTVARNARRMAKLAEQVGLSTLASVASDVGQAAEVGNDAAQAATLARLVRTGEKKGIDQHDATAPADPLHVLAVLHAEIEDA